MTVKKTVDDAIAQHPILVYSKSYCPYSRRAIDLLASIPGKIAQPKVFELDLLGDQGVQIQDYLAELTHQRTVPNIFIKQKHIGGADDLAHLHEAGALKPLVVPLPNSRVFGDQQSKFKHHLQGGMNQFFFIILFLVVGLVVIGSVIKSRLYTPGSTRLPEKQKL